MTYEETLSWIHGTERFGSRLGLERMRELLHRLGDPQDRLQFIHIAGTNGKGSTTTMIASALQTAGWRTGKFISPYILEFRERMQINGEMISPEELAAVADIVRPVSEELAREGNPPTEFELVTAIGFLWFARRNCDIAALEVGLGGRLDATNVISAPLAAVITRIDYDHTAILGDTLTAIAGEKCGILKKGSHVVCYPDQNPEALAVIRRSAASLEAPLTVPDLTQLTVLSSTLGGSRIRYRGTEFRVPFAGLHQIMNAVTAVEALRALADTRFALPEEAIAAGIAAAEFPARLEVLQQEPPVLLDGAHNPNGGRALRDALEALGLRDLTVVVGMLRDKDCQPVLEMMAPYCRRMIVTSVPNPRTHTAEALAALAAPYCREIAICEDCKEAVRVALQKAEGGVLVFGSLYLASAVRPILLKEIKGTWNDSTATTI